MNTQLFDTIIIGAGAAGIMCAIEAGKRGQRVLLLDKAKKAGRKILISGGGRCNFTNLDTRPSAFLSANPHFCKSALARYTARDFTTLMEKHSLSWNEKKLGQLFCDQKAPALVNMLLDECNDAGAQTILNCEINSVEKNKLFKVISSQGNYESRSLVIATGGPSIPRMGSTDFGLQIAKQFGLKNINFTAALVPFVFSQKIISNHFKSLAGVSVDVEINCNGITFRENLLFTHKGLSGPAVLQISSYWRKGDSISINLLPDTNVFEWLIEQKSQHPKAELKTVLSTVLPKRIAISLCEFLIENKTMNQFSEKDLSQLAEQLSHWQLEPTGTEGMKTAEVAMGGVSTNELSSKTFESKKVPGLFFIGETVDVTGHLGGYNLQWAWSSGWCAGQYV